MAHGILGLDGKRIIIKNNVIVVSDSNEPKKPKRENRSNRFLNIGTFALQGHDSGSSVCHKELW